jgi:hypothetical protein
VPHDDSTRRLVALALLGLCVTSLRLVWGVSGEFPINLGTPARAQQDGCTLVTPINGRGNQASPSRRRDRPFGSSSRPTTPTKPRGRLSSR